jgi:hypothetical protein
MKLKNTYNFIVYFKIKIIVIKIIGRKKKKKKRKK